MVTSIGNTSSPFVNSSSEKVNKSLGIDLQWNPGCAKELESFLLHDVSKSFSQRFTGRSPNPETVNQILKNWSSEKLHILVARNKDLVVGVLDLAISDKRVAEMGFIVADAFHGQGIGRQLSDTAKHYATKTLQLEALVAEAVGEGMGDILPRLGYFHREGSIYVCDLGEKLEWTDDFDVSPRCCQIL